MSNRLLFFAFVQCLNLKLNRKNVEATSLPRWKRGKDASSTLYHEYRQTIDFLALTDRNAIYCGQNGNLLQ